MFFFARSLRTQIFVRTNLDSFHHFGIRLFIHRCSLWDHVVDIFLLRTASISVWEAICPSFPEQVLTPVESPEPSCAPDQCSFTTIVFTRLGTSVQEEECCCCWLCQFFFNVTLGAGLGVSSLSKSTRSPFWDVTRSVQSPCIVAWVMIANDFVCQSLILRLWQSYPVHCFLVILRNIRCFLWNCEVVIRLLFLRVISKRIRWC